MPQKKKSIIVLAPRPPYPVIGGDRLRIYKICEELSKYYSVTLLAQTENKYFIKERHSESKIFDEIKTNGYRKSDLDQDNAEVAIDSHGHYLLIDGRHRVAFAQILGVKKIPVVVNIISEKLAKSYFTENSMKSSINKDLAKALSDNKSQLFKQLDQESIKDRLTIASIRD